MNLLDRLKQAEAAATPGPWSRDIQATEADEAFALLLCNHAAALIRLVEAAHDAWYMDRDPQLKEALAPFLAEENAL